jgi:hypothetical protein
VETISAWVYDPSRSLFKAANDRATAYKITCQNPRACDLYTKNNSCILTTALRHCKFGRKTSVSGPTKRSRSFYSWIRDREKENAEWIGKLDSNKAWNRIAKVQDQYYLPYAFMSPGSFGGDDSYALQSEWVQADALTSGLLDRICSARPRAMFGGEIRDYQTKEVPKFLSDLRMFYPDLFALLPEKHKSRALCVNSVGRLADITTCLPGRYVFSDKMWTWDGKVLTGGSMLFQPVKGKIEISITPEPGQGVKITDAAQVGPNTVFLD